MCNGKHNLSELVPRVFTFSHLRSDVMSDKLFEFGTIYFIPLYVCMHLCECVWAGMLTFRCIVAIFKDHWNKI